MIRVSFLGLGIGILVATTSAPARGEMVVQRWGQAGHVQHPGSVTFQEAGSAGTLMRIDLAALPEGAKIYRARLVFSRSAQGYGEGFDIVPADSGDRGSVQAAGPRLELVPPVFRWFDATPVVQQWSAARRKVGQLLLRRAPDFDRRKTWLEIAYEGRLGEKPRQVSDLKAFYRAGQVFLTFREIEDLSEGLDDYAWGKLIEKGKGYNSEMLIPKDDPRELRYRVYRHTAPITAASIGQAELLAEVVPGSRFNTRQVRRIFMGEQVPSKLDDKFLAVRLAVEDGKPLTAGVGKYVHTVARPGRGYYAVVTAVNGVENTAELSQANTAGPIEEQVAPPEPVLYREVSLKLDHNRGAYVQRWYNWYVGQPLSCIPLCYDVVVGYCPSLRSRPAPVYVHRGHSWIIEPEPATPSATPRIDLAHSSDDPNAFWMGINDAHNTLKGLDEGRWQPFPQRRQTALLEWLNRQHGVDWNQVSVGVGAWGMMELERPDLYAALHGWGLPEISKGFQAWQRAGGVWGPPQAYASRPNEENPFWRQDYSRYILENTARETPFFHIHLGWGAHFTEMGWPPLPRFLRALVDTRRPFIFRWQIRDGLPVVRRNQSLPAFGNCSLDDNPGNGDLRNGETFDAQINGYLNWDAETIVDRPDRWEMTVWLDKSAPLPECTVDLTPRRCQQFKAPPGQSFRWANVAEDKPIQAGTARADRHGLVTLEKLVVSKARNRIAISR